MAEGVPGDRTQCAAGATGSGAAAKAEVLESDQGSKPAVLLSRCWGLGRIRKRYHAGVMFPT